MAVTTLDPKTALIVIALQKGVAGLPPAHPAGAVAAEAARLAGAFRRCRLGVAPGGTEQARPAFVFPDDWRNSWPS